MSSQSISALWMFGIYAVYVLLPIIPTVVIYRLFPETTVSIGGIIQGLRLNAGGAFAAYVATVLLGGWIAHSAVGVIEGYRKSMWTVSADVKLRDASGNLLNDSTDLAQLTVELVPPIFEVSDKEDDKNPAHPVYFKHVDVKVPVAGDEWPRLKYSVPNYEAISIDIPTDSQKAPDEINYRVQLDPIVLPRMQSDYVANASALTEPTERAQYPDATAGK